ENGKERPPNADKGYSRGHSSTVVSEEPEASVWPSGENASASTAALWAERQTTSFPSVPSHHTSMPPLVPRTSRRPSGEKARDVTTPRSPGDPRDFPVVTSQTVTRPSADVASRVPSGLSATVRILPATGTATSSFPLSRFHTRTLPSWHGRAMNRPSAQRAP